MADVRERIATNGVQSRHEHVPRSNTHAVSTLSDADVETAVREAFVSAGRSTNADAEDIAVATGVRYIRDVLSEDEPDLEAFVTECRTENIGLDELIDVLAFAQEAVLHIADSNEISPAELTGLRRLVSTDIGWIGAIYNEQ